MPQDYVQARQWFEKAAAQGLAVAQYKLGYLYAEGQGVPQDYVRAREWYERAATQGLAVAQYNLGYLYAEAHGVPQDYIQAHKWYNLAGANGDKEAASLRDALAKKMTQDQIAEAQRLAREWKPKNP